MVSAKDLLVKGTARSALLCRALRDSALLPNSTKGCTVVSNRLTVIFLTFIFIFIPHLLIDYSLFSTKASQQIDGRLSVFGFSIPTLLLPNEEYKYKFKFSTPLFKPKKQGKKYCQRYIT